ncbi:hypothetical protein HSBGL_0120 [Halapricum desulfuricans]|uniref:Uncharacterized protein n=1 Tax=Halapricum desulfuricans TaxID=2841257 RepID=A0A897ND33_9EURY|nr:hypothetical protein HSBGL_0120 [Halapricum desulfuricans]
MTSGFLFEPESGLFPVPLQAPQVSLSRMPVPPHSGQCAVFPGIIRQYVLILY